MKNIKTLLEEIEKEKELLEAGEDMEQPEAQPKAPDESSEDDEDAPEEKLEDYLHQGKSDYTPEDLIEIVKYCETLIEKENDENDEDGEKKGNSDLGEIGLDLIAAYAQMMPSTVISQIIHDLQDIFELEDTMLESVITEGASFFTNAKNSPAKKAAKELMINSYKKNKTKIDKRNDKWKYSDIAKKIAKFHKLAFKGLGKIKGKKLHPDLNKGK